ncbi:hypothetical protein [Streptomyces sp. HM190]|uniref:hypothetical protein n=1 Tax=Streptomyces sp. HM190 TaxID=2695266 RepID=UPI0013573CD0|nr:hypothetical protein [Streptomyces sp. HM190]
MRTRRAIGAVTAALALTLVGCTGGEEAGLNDNKGSDPSAEASKALRAAGIPPEPTGAQRAQLLRALAAVDPDIVKYEEKAVDAARNQCSAINGNSSRADWTAAQRFTYRDVTTTEAQGKQINEALEGLGFCKV